MHAHTGIHPFASADHRAILALFHIAVSRYPRAPVDEQPSPFPPVLSRDRDRVIRSKVITSVARARARDPTRPRSLAVVGFCFAASQSRNRNDPEKRLALISRSSFSHGVPLAICTLAICRYARPSIRSPERACCPASPRRREDDIPVTDLTILC